MPDHEMYCVADPNDPLAEARLVDEYWRRQGRPAKEEQRGGI